MVWIMGKTPENVIPSHKDACTPDGDNDPQVTMVHDGSQEPRVTTNNHLRLIRVYEHS